ncbi:MAG: acyltransferase family protein [Prevotellaceae bacterium]|nr:acyltransferase family protein [Candidatus Faecinaster equi]
MKNNMNKRNIVLDIAKGLTIVLVVIGHFFPKNSPESYVKLHQWIYSFHMPLFMFISGYIYLVYKNKDLSYSGFICNKIKRLMIPYFFVSTIIITLKILSSGNAYLQNPATVFSYLEMFYLPSAGYFMWFLWSLFTIFLIVPIFKNKKLRLCLFVFSLLLNLLSFKFSFPRLFSLHETQTHFVWFMLGVLVADYSERYSNVLCLWCKIISIASFVILSFIISKVNMGIFEKIMPLFGIPAVLSLSSIISRISGKFTFIIADLLGIGCFIIYLCHTTFAGFAKAVFKKLPVGDDLFFLEAIVVILAGLIFPILLDHFVIRRFKFTRFIFAYK